jgi:hypothetical protein
MKNSPYNSVTYGLPSGGADTGFDPQRFWENYGAQKRELQIYKLNKEAQNRKAWESAYDPSKLVPEKIYKDGADEINIEIDAFSEKMAQAAASGKSPDLSREYAASKARINNLATMQAENQKMLENFATIYTKDLGKYHPSTYEKFMKDMPEGIEEGNKYLKTNNPLAEDIHWLDVLPKWTGEPDVNENSQGVTVEKLDRGKVKARIYDNYLKQPKQQQQLLLDEVMGMVDEKGKPIAKTLDEAVEYFTDKAMDMGVEKVTRVGNTGGGSNNSNSSGGTSGDAAKYTIGRDNTNNKAPVRVSFGHTRENPVTMELVTNDNQKRNVNVIGLHQVGGKWVIDVTYEDTEGNELTEVISADKFDGSPQSKDTHNYQRISDYMGGDFVEKVYGGGGGKTAPKTQGKKDKFVGVPTGGF